MTTATATANRNQSGSAPKPWIERGLSERTYYRRKAAGVLDAALPPEQHAAHVKAWFATLDAMARLDYRGFVRRCLTKRATPRRDDIQKLYMRALGVN